MMSDNRTTELKSLSKLKMAGKLRYWRGTIEIPESELHAICDEIQAEHDRAVAATLGSERERELELLVKQLWYLVNHRSGYGYAAALESIEELGLEVD